MRIRAVLFDLDGVLIKSMEQHLEAWQHAFSRFGVFIHADDFYHLEGRGVKKVVQALLAKYQIDPELEQQILNEKVAYYDRIFKADFYDGLFDLLDYLKQKQILMGVVTGGMRNRVCQIVEKHFSGYFDCVITSDDVENTKPFPEPYLTCAAKLGLNSEECIVIENAPLGIQSAIGARMKVIALTSTLEKENLKRADYIVDSFAEIENLFKNWNRKAI